MKITCSSCGRLLTIDESKLPMREVSFPCPACKERLVVDRRHLPDSEPAAPVMAETSFEEPDDDDLSAISIVVGVDDRALRAAIRKIGFKPVVPPSIEAARELYIQQHPPVVFLRPAQLTPPPLVDMAPILAVNPADRRVGFFILVGDNLRTFDGNAAFLYGVNLTLSTKDLESIESVFAEAQKDHQRLYGPLLAVLDELKGVRL